MGLQGIGPHTAAAAVAGGAAGVVLDSQLALLADSGLPETTAAALRAMDGSETTVVEGHRVLRPSKGRAAEASGARLLPVRQDGFLAARFAERWGDVRRTVGELTAAIRGNSAAGDVVRAADSAMSRVLSTRLPVAQGHLAELPPYQARVCGPSADRGHGHRGTSTGPERAVTAGPPAPSGPSTTWTRSPHRPRSCVSRRSAKTTCGTGAASDGTAAVPQ